MKKTIIALLALSGIAMADSITRHSTVFDTEYTTASKITQNNANIYISGPTSGASAYTPNTTLGGLYMAEGTGLKFNNSAQISLNYLYIGADIVFGGHNTNVAGEINWTSGGSLLINSTEGAWVDVNFSTGNKINTSNMVNGTVYLNDKGSLTSTLPNTNKVEAELLTSGYESISGYSYDDATQVLTRTLMTGDFTAWNPTASNVILTNLQALDPTKVQYIADAQGLRVTYDMSSVPEPTTGTLSLLALAGLCARRRKK